MKLLISTSFASLLLLFGCSPSQNPANPILDGSIYGQVQIQESYTEFFHPSNVSGVLDGGSMQTVTDSDGNWSFNNVPIGTHEVLVSKSGYGSTELYNIQVAPNGIAEAPIAVLCPVPTQRLYLDSVVLTNPTLPITSSSQWQVFVTFDSGTPKYAVFIDSSPNIQPSDTHLYMSDGTNLYSFYEPLVLLGYHSGDKLYMSACVYNAPYNTEGTYYDPADDQNILIAPGPKSNVVVFTMP
jgi:hypothetical protein